MILSVKKLSSGYGDKLVTKDVNLEVAQGQILSLIGPNGSGKTTILKTIAGFIPPLDGEVLFEGVSSHQIGQQEKSKFMSVMMTERMVTELMTIRDVVALGRFPYTGLLGRLTAEDEGIVEEAICKVGLGKLADQIYNDLSDGQKQRTLLARAIAQKPKLMILDEPTSYLDIHHKLKFINILKDLAKTSDIGVLMSVHELEIAYEISDNIVCLNGEGSVVASGAPQEVLGRGIIENLYDLEPGSLETMYGGFLQAIRGE